MARRLAWAAVLAVFALMTLGNVVSATGSGLACPDWPLCHGRLIPPFRADVLVEYGHRLAALGATLLVLATVVVSLRRATAPGLRRVAWWLPVLLAAQIGLGGVTVLFGLPHLISTAHLINALLILAGLLLLALGSGPARGAAPRAAGARTMRLAHVGLIVLLVQLALGGYVRHAGAGLACPDFPLCSGDVIPGHWLAAVHWAHRWLGLALLGLFIHLALAARRSALAPGTVLLATLAVLQVVLGIATVLLRLDPPIRAAHAGMGYALWVTLLWISVRAGCWERTVAGAAPGGCRAREAVRAA